MLVEAPGRGSMSNIRFQRHSISLDRRTLDMCRELADTTAQSISATIPSAVRDAHRNAHKNGLLTEIAKDGSNDYAE